MTLELALNPFENKKPGKKADIEQKVEFELDEKVERMMEQYRQTNFHRYFFNSAQVNSLEYEILNPAQIDILLQKIIQETPKHKTEHITTSHILSKIIQKSYEEGHNNFTLTTKKTEMVCVGHKLKGTLENLIQITIQGNIGAYFGERSENCTYNLTGDTDDRCGANSKNCTYNIQRNTGFMCGYNSENCEYNIQGNVGGRCGDGSENCTYNLYGNIGEECGWNSIKCTFTTPNKEIYKRIRKDIKKNAKKSKVKLRK